MNLSRYFSFLPVAALLFFSLSTPRYGEMNDREKPNLWIVADDLGPDLSCYGAQLVQTPNLDRLASISVLYSNFFSVGAVCSPSRSSLVTGMYPVSINSHQHRPRERENLPNGIQPISSYFREHGYFVVNGNSENRQSFGKTDYNFTHTQRELYDGSDWSQREKGQPFFAQIQIKYPHRPFTPDTIHPVNADRVILPPYYPNTALARKDWARYLETVQLTDQHVGNVLRRLVDEGLMENTIIFFFGDQGQPHVRAKQFLYDAGIRTPLIVHIPKKHRKHGVKDDRIVSTVDIAVATLALAGIPIPNHMQGVNFLDDSAAPREYAFSMRDRCDETVDRIRSVRGKRFKYIRNYYPERPYTQFNAYKKANYPVLTQMQVMYRDGLLNEVQSRFMADTRPSEELYDTSVDPHEVENLATHPEFQYILSHFHKIMDQWLTEADHGVYPEPDESINYARELMRKNFTREMEKKGLQPDIDDREYLLYWERLLLGSAAGEKH